MAAVLPPGVRPAGVSPMGAGPLPTGPELQAQQEAQRQAIQAQLEQQRIMNLEKAAQMGAMDEPHNPISVKVDAEEHLLHSTSVSAITPFPLPPTIPPSTLSLPLSDPRVFSGSPLTPVQLDDLLVKVNALAQLFKRAPDGAIPPPPQALDRQRQVQVAKFKEEGNSLFKAKQFQGSVQFYSLALKVAVERMPWEAGGFQREELGVILCNRAAAYGAIGEWERSLLDSKAVIAYKRSWSKGHFRAAKALVELGRLYEAQEALLLGLSFEPDNVDLNAFRTEIEVKVAAAEEAEWAQLTGEKLAAPLAAPCPMDSQTEIGEAVN